MAEQSLLAIDEADVVFFVVDARDGLTPVDEEIAKYIRQTSKPVTLVINKIDGLNEDLVANDFYALGMSAMKLTAASHNRGVHSLIEEAMSDIPEQEENRHESHGCKIGIIGRPNVGKSTLINALAGRYIAHTGNEPAVTKRQQMIDLKNGVILSDTPGILWPKFENSNSGYRLATSGAIKDTAMEYDDVGFFAADYLIKAYPVHESCKKYIFIP